MCSGLLRALESFSNQAAWNNPDRYWISILTLVNWVGNVLLPLYGVLQVVLAVAHYAGLLERMTIGEAWVRNLVAAMCCFGLSGLLRLGEFWIQHGTAGVPLGRRSSDAIAGDTSESEFADTSDLHVLEFEDLFVVLGAAAVMNVVGHFVGGEIAGMPMNLVLQYGVPLFMVPVLMAFKYGKPRGYVRDLASGMRNPAPTARWRATVKSGPRI